MAVARASNPTRRHGVAVCCVLLTALSLVSCGFPLPRPQPGEGPGGRQQPLSLNPAQELELGRRTYRQVLQEMRDKVLPKNSEEVRRVRQVLTRVARAAAIEPLQREINLRVRGYEFEWEANVVREHEVNAFCLPGGKVVVYTGLLGVAKNDDQLAVVLAHEVAHALAHHSSERLAREQDNGLFGIFRALKYERMQEEEADHIGLFLMTFADYNPEEAVHFWERMSQATEHQGRLPEILSDHPSDAHRIEAMRRWVPAARAARKALEEGRIAPASR